MEPVNVLSLGKKNMRQTLLRTIHSNRGSIFEADKKEQNSARDGFPRSTYPGTVVKQDR